MDLIVDNPSETSSTNLSVVRELQGCSAGPVTSGNLKSPPNPHTSLIDFVGSIHTCPELVSRTPTGHPGSQAGRHSLVILIVSVCVQARLVPSRVEHLQYPNADSMTNWLSFPGRRGTVPAVARLDVSVCSDHWLSGHGCCKQPTQEQAEFGAGTDPGLDMVALQAIPGRIGSL